MILYTIYLKRSLYALIFKTALIPEHRIIFCWVSNEYQYLFCLSFVLQNFILFVVTFALYHSVFNTRLSAIICSFNSIAE